MDIRTYRARSMQEAIELVRQDLGADASVLHAREVKSGVMRWMGGGRRVEVTASAAISAPSRFAEHAGAAHTAAANHLEADAASAGSRENGFDSQSAYVHQRDREQHAIPSFFNAQRIDADSSDAIHNQSHVNTSNHSGAVGTASIGSRQAGRTVNHVLDAKADGHFETVTIDETRERLRRLAKLDLSDTPDGGPRSRQLANDPSSPNDPSSASDQTTYGQDTATNGQDTDRQTDNRPTTIAQAVDAHASQSATTPCVSPSGDAATAPDENEANDARMQIFAALLEANLNEQNARELLERVDWSEPLDDHAVMRHLSGMVEEDLRIAGAIRAQAGQPRVVALVGPTGVGKTTTVAKLAANFRLREQLRVGLITVDTYRIAAVNQLQTYADIIDLPLKVVATAQEMRDAIESMSDLDLILMDTAGRSPKDEVKILELRALLAEAGADEVHLVLSCTAGERHLRDAAMRFQEAGVSSLILSKLDEAEGLGGLLPMLRETRLPLSYVTLGQNVPDDIQIASSRRIADAIVGRVNNEST